MSSANKDHYELLPALYPDGKGGQSEWYYEPTAYCDHRYILGVLGPWSEYQNPLICVGINPSTAQPGALDNTLKSVERIANNNHHDGWIMLNVYPQRATNPNDLHQEPDAALVADNLKWAASLLWKLPQATIWAAWGTLIEKRPWLFPLLGDLAKVCNEADVDWVTYGPRSKAGHPHHPLYLRKDSRPESFDINAYLAGNGVL